MLRGCHEPGARVVRDPGLRPALERGDEGVLRQVLRETDVAHDPRETGDQAGRLDPPDRVDRAMGIGAQAASRHRGSRSSNSTSSLRSTGGLGKRLIHSIASCRDFKWISAAYLTLQPSRHGAMVLTIIMNRIVASLSGHFLGPRPISRNRSTASLFPKSSS